MTTVDDLWYLADEAAQQAEQTYHRLADRATDVMEFETTKRVSRRRFRTVAERITDNGAPYGTHTLAYRPSGEVVLVRHEGVDLWVLPGGETHADETFREGAARELAEEAGLAADYEGLALLGRVRFQSDDHDTWGVLPVFAAEAEAAAPSVEDPDDEISAAEWFADLPPDTRDRSILSTWLDDRFDGQ
ncbi:NUDIX hydrolase [Halobacteriales archaeon Cl-PHB]